MTWYDSGLVTRLALLVRKMSRIASPLVGCSLTVEEGVAHLLEDYFPQHVGLSS